MDTSVFRRFSDIETKEVAPGFFSKLIHTDNTTINFVEVKAGNTVPLHQHIHQQCTFVLEGKFELTVNGEPQTLDAGLFAVIPSNAPHSGVAITDCRIVDTFYPVREDYKLL